MNKRALIAAMCCMVAALLVLAGCAGEDEATKAKKAFSGTWNLVEMTQGGETTNSSEWETLKSLGMEIYVNLNEDGTAALVLFGEPFVGTWEAKSPTEGTLKLEELSGDMVIQDSKLKFEQDGSSMVFEKGEPKEVPAATAATSSASAGSGATAEGSASADASAGGSASAGSAASSATAEGSAGSATAESAASNASADASATAEGSAGSEASQAERGDA